MLPWVLVYEDHYRHYCEKNVRPHDLDSFVQFLREIGTPSLLFQTPSEQKISSFVRYRQVPLSSCIRLRTPEEYMKVVNKNVYCLSMERQDKSRRSSSCVIM